MNPLAAGESHDSCDYPATYSLAVNSFHMDRYEVTNDEMVRVMQWAYEQDPPLITVSFSTVQNAEGDPQQLLDLDSPYGGGILWNGSSFGMKSEKGSGHPCVEVSWYGAAAYCNYRSEMEGRTPCYNLSDWSCNFSAGGYRLPTSEEWEYAARGGLVGKRFPWGDTISHSQANYWAGDDCDYDLSCGEGYHPDYDGLSPVGQFAPNAYGLYDVAGNVWEWCHDSHPCRPGSRVIHGSSWAQGASYCRVGHRIWIFPQDTASLDGFRAVRSSLQ